MVYLLLQTLWLKASFCLFSSYLKRNAGRQINFCSSFAIYNYNYSFSEKIVIGCLLFGSKSPFVLRSFLTNGIYERIERLGKFPGHHKRKLDSSVVRGILCYKKRLKNKVDSESYLIDALTQASSANIY